MASWTSDSYEGRYLQLTITEKVNTPENSSTLSWTLTSAGGIETYYTVDATTVTINGTTVYSKGRTYWSDRVFPAAKGSVSGTINVPHNSDGSKTVTIGFSTRVYIYGSLEYGGTMTLTNIDRTAPTVSFSINSITAKGFSVSATSSAVCDIWQYSVNDGSSWTQFSTAEGTSASATISNLTANTSYTVKVRARKKSNQIYGVSQSVSVKTLGGTEINSVQNVTADNSTVYLYLNTTVYNASYTHTLKIKNGNSVYLTISSLKWSLGTASRTVTLTSAQRTTLLNAMSGFKSFKAVFELTTFNGSAQIGTASTFTAEVKTTEANSAPTLSGFSYRDSNSTTVSITGNSQYLIQGYSTLTVTPGTASAKNGASIENYTASCNGVSVSNTVSGDLTIGIVTASGSVEVVLTVTDSRGYTCSKSVTITVIAYEKPKISSVTLRRTNDIESEMQLKFSGSISPVTINGTMKNTVRYIRYRYKKTNQSSYGSYYSILSTADINGSSFSYENLELCNLDANYSYDFHLQIQDRLYTSTALDIYFVVPQGTPLIALRKGKVGINTPNPQSALDVEGEIRMNGFNIMGLVMEAVPDDTNLNDLTSPGIYFRRATPVSGLNYPVLNIGMLEVFSCNTNVVIQRYTKRDSPFTMYVRSKVNSSWNAWVQKS